MNIEIANTTANYFDIMYLLNCNSVGEHCLAHGLLAMPLRPSPILIPA